MCVKSPDGLMGSDAPKQLITLKLTELNTERVAIKQGSVAQEKCGDEAARLNVHFSMCPKGKAPPAAGLTAANSILDRASEPDGFRFSPATAVVRLGDDSQWCSNWRNGRQQKPNVHNN